MIYNIVITLKSDLCAADGDGFAAAIDSDICTDRFGMPIIPARRIKGCLRDAARFIFGDNNDVINDIFGRTGSDRGCKLRISDAHPLNCDEISRAVKTSPNITPAMVTELFTYTRACTAIDDESGSAKDQSLRFMRVVKHFDPDSGEEMQFSARAEIPEEYSVQFGMICKALRNIGLRRSRGLGAVSCRLVKAQDDIHDIPEYSFSADRKYTIRYTVMLTDDVMISGGSSDESLDFIPGTSLLGFFAAEYLKNHAADGTFEDIFLKNGVRFSNLYISDKNGSEYYPAPVVVGKIKGVPHAVNVIKIDAADDTHIVKPLKSGYTNNTLNIKHPLTETVYHISMGESGNLYTQTAIRSGQYFSGTVSGRGELIESIYDIMRGGIIRVGRSKTAQYSSCRILRDGFIVVPSETEKIHIRRGEIFAAAAVSDLLIPNGACGYVSDMKSFVQAVSGAFGFACTEPDAGMKMKRSALRYRNIFGFNTQWKLSKPHVRAVAAGSAAVFTADRDYELPVQLWLGDRNGEGFGCVRLIRSEELEYSPEEKEAQPEVVSSLFEKAEEDERMKEAALEYSLSHELDITSSQTGRIILMAKQSESADDFMGRISSITDTDTSEKLIKYFGKDIAAKWQDKWREYVILLLTLEKYKHRKKEENKA